MPSSSHTPQLGYSITFSILDHDRTRGALVPVEEETDLKVFQNLAFELPSQNTRIYSSILHEAVHDV
jgi:hypothetical protein